MNEFLNFFSTTAIAQMSLKPALMMVVGLAFLFLGIYKKYEPLLLVPIGFGIVLGNIPGTFGVYTTDSVLNLLYFGVKSGRYS